MFFCTNQNCRLCTRHVSFLSTIYIALTAPLSDSSLFTGFTKQASSVINSAPRCQIPTHNQDTLSFQRPFSYVVGVGQKQQEKQREMGGNNRQRKSSSGFFSVFNMFKSKKNRGGYYDAYHDGMKARKVWPSDEDRGRRGVAEPGIDMKAEAFILQYKKRISESERFQLDPAAGDAQ